MNRAVLLNFYYNQDQNLTIFLKWDKKVWLNSYKRMEVVIVLIVIVIVLQSRPEPDNFPKMG